MQITFSAPGEPKGKQRPRFTRTGRTYTPKETAVYENLVRLSCIQENKDVKLSGALQADITAYFGVPASVSKKKREAMLADEIPCAKKPDTDNLAKTILDALNSVAYDDDRQVIRLTVTKKYGEQPRVDVIVKELEGK